MSIDGTPAGRLRKLEAIWQRPQTCQTCYGWPTRLTYADPDTDVVWWESLPETGCPECGTRLKGRGHRKDGMLADASHAMHRDPR